MPSRAELEALSKAAKEYEAAVDALERLVAGIDESQARLDSLRAARQTARDRVAVAKTALIAAANAMPN